ncbi:MAG: IS66 family transposase [Snowella sp.]|nr:IS66 family transposase [Snowella sp.]PZV22108.1 MAG: IS66 family transposase [Snowella sp.]
MSKKIITSEVFVAYTQCPLKAFLLLFSDEQGVFHDYPRILEERRQVNKIQYLKKVKQSHENVEQYNQHDLNEKKLLIEATLRAGCWEAHCDVLTKVETNTSNKAIYEPTIVVGTYSVTQEQKAELLFVGQVLGLIQEQLPGTGKIVGMDGKSHQVKLESGYKMIAPFIKILKQWAEEKPPKTPALILNRHCSSCQFQSLCQAQAKQEDNLSLLAHVTSKIIRHYEKKGIFTIKQLSYLYKPRRCNKRKKQAPVQLHKIELQALAIRTNKIYIHELPELNRKPIELFFDIEGIPDQKYEYLLGLLVCDETNSCKYYSFWADTCEDELLILQKFIEMVTQYPDAPIYHYGDYESRAINKLARRYESNIGVDIESIQNRLVNINTYIYGRIYFPVYSNGLKNIGRFIGAAWTSSEASGLQSLVWRYHWDNTQDKKYKDLLLIYNREDCQSLKLLTDKLSTIKNSADTLSEIDFADQPKQQKTGIGTELHDQFEIILKIAHADYNKGKISLRRNENGNQEKLKRGAQKGHEGHTKSIPKVHKIISLVTRLECPKHEHAEQPLTESIRTIEYTIVDLIFAKNSIKKIIIKYVGKKSFCSECKKYYNPLTTMVNPDYFSYGHGIKAWVIYHRLFLRLPYRVITETLEDQFGEKIAKGSITNFLKYFSNYYIETEIFLVKKILESPFIHADETIVNIQGFDQYVWVFTDGIHVIFKLTPTREASVVHEFLGDYTGTLISDFYAGYDSVKCKQQKCWVHLIRDMNDDLWKAPFDIEYEGFILEVRNLIVPILQTAEEHGLKSKKLSKFNSSVEKFYEDTINKNYKSELTLKYQKRLLRYRESLFTFLNEDNIPWNNNTGERALRHLAVQRKISGTFFESMMPHYLLLLGIMQTCRFQNKSFLQFLLSKEKDIDKFKKRK